MSRSTRCHHWPPVKHDQRSRMMVGCLGFLVILQSLFPPATTNATPQLTWSAATKPATQEGQGSQLQTEMFLKIFHQIEKAGRRKAIEGRKLSRRYLINWSQSGRQLSPFLPPVSLELETFVYGKVGREGKSPALIHWGKLRYWSRGPGGGSKAQLSVYFRTSKIYGRIKILTQFPHTNNPNNLLLLKYPTELSALFCFSYGTPATRDEILYRSLYIGTWRGNAHLIASASVACQVTVSFTFVVQRTKNILGSESHFGGYEKKLLW